MNTSAALSASTAEVEQTPDELARMVSASSISTEKGRLNGVVSLRGEKYVIVSAIYLRGERCFNMFKLYAPEKFSADFPELKTFDHYNDLPSMREETEAGTYGMRAEGFYCGLKARHKKDVYRIGPASQSIDLKTEGFDGRFAERSTFAESQKSIRSCDKNTPKPEVQLFDLYDVQDTRIAEPTLFDLEAA